MCHGYQRNMREEDFLWQAGHLGNPVSYVSTCQQEDARREGPSPRLNLCIETRTWCGQCPYFIVKTKK